MFCNEGILKGTRPEGRKERKRQSATGNWQRVQNEQRSGVLAGNGMDLYLKLPVVIGLGSYGTKALKEGIYPLDTYARCGFTHLNTLTSGHGGLVGESWAKIPKGKAVHSSPKEGGGKSHGGSLRRMSKAPAARIPNQRFPRNWN